MIGPEKQLPHASRVNIIQSEKQPTLKGERGMWIYESHMGGLYAVNQYQDSDDLYCEECGDSDWEIGFAETKEEARKLLKDSGYYERYVEGYCEEFLSESFEEESFDDAD